MENSVCAVVVTYNRIEKLKKCIECLLKQKVAKCDVVIVDNNSTDGTGSYISSKYNSSEGIFYYNSGRNLGGAGGFEFGVREAVRLGYEYVWIMDDDTWVSDTALFELFRADKALNGRWGFLSSVAYWIDGSVCKANIQKKNVFRFVKKSDYGKAYSRVQFASFVSLLVKASVVCEVGLPIGDYFIWTDDYEYTGRISKKYLGYMVPGSKVEHAMVVHSKANVAKDDISRIDRYKYLFRNDVHCYKQQGAIGWMYIIFKDIYMAISVIIKATEKRERIKVITEGIREGRKFCPTVKWVK